MCMAVYLASDSPLELLAWNEAEPAFHVTALSAGDERVRRQFETAHVVYVGSHEGCGCGFQYGAYPPDELELGEREKRRRSLEQLAAYLRRQVGRVGALELFACWEGDQEASPEHRRTLTPASLEADDFFFREKELSRVVASVGR
jgi:hypothetical protein